MAHPDSKKDFLAVAVFSIFFILIAAPRLQFPDLDHGDDYSDANILNAGENFLKLGFWKCKFLPTFEVGPGMPANFYTHYPPLPDILNGILRFIFRTSGLWLFRSVAIVSAFLSVLFWYLFVRNFTGSILIGFLSAFFYLSNSMFIFCVDALHQPIYADFLRNLTFFVLLASVDRPKKKPAPLLLLWALFFLQSLVSVEYIIYLALFFLFFKIAVSKSKGFLTNKAIVILFLAPVAGFLLHLLQNAWYFGSFTKAVQDLRGIAGRGVAAMQNSSIATNPLNWWQYVIVRNVSLGFLFNYFLLALFIFVSYLLYGKLSAGAKKETRISLSLLAILSICGISWYTVFPSHSIAHTFILFLARHIVPAASLFFAVVSYIALVFVKERKPRNLFAVFFVWISIAAIALTGILKSELPVTKEKRDRAKDFLVFKECMSKMKQASLEKDKIGMNYFRSPFIRYYTHREALVIFEKEELQSPVPLPRFFLFFPYNEKRSVELLQFLEEKYAPLFQCASSRFPGIFYELKTNESTVKK